jgi:hypothetical protein
VTMDHDVDVILLEHAEIGFGLDRIGGSKKDVLKIGSQHRSPPAVGDGCPSSLFHQVFVILVDTDVRSMHDFDNFSVDIARQYAGFLPFIIQRGRGTL